MKSCLANVVGFGSGEQVYRLAAEGPHALHGIDVAWSMRARHSVIQAVIAAMAISGATVVPFVGSHFSEECVVMYALGKSIRTGAMTLAISTNVAAIEPAPLDDTAFERWAGFLIVRPLVDGSRLSVYQARTVSDGVASQTIPNKDTASDEAPGAALTNAGVDDVALRIAFVPRFECVPLLSIVASGDTGLALSTSMTGMGSLRMTIDDTEHVVAVAMETDVDRTYLWFKLATSAQIELLAEIDLASRASVELPDNEYEFSLLGSQHSSEATHAHCLDYEPIPVRRR